MWGDPVVRQHLPFLPLFKKIQMKSTIVIYGHESKLTKSDAKHIAYYLGAQTTCTHHINKAIMNGVDNIVLCLPSFNAEGAEKEWVDFFCTFRDMDLTGKCFALYVPSDSFYAKKVIELEDVLYHQGARVINRPFCKPHYTIDTWICAVSPNL